jgi:hypothetical protein
MCGYRHLPALSRALDQLVRVGALYCQRRRRTSNLYTFPPNTFSSNRFTIITKDSLQKLVGQVGRTTAGVYLILLAVANGRRRFAKKMDDILPLLNLSARGLDRSVAKLARCGRIRTRHGVITEWAMLENPGAKSAKNAKTPFLNPPKTTFLKQSKTESEVDFDEVDIYEGEEENTEARSPRAFGSQPEQDHYIPIRDRILECCGCWEPFPLGRRDSAMVRQIVAATEGYSLESILSSIEAISDMIAAHSGDVEPSRILKTMLKFLREGEWPGWSGVV